MFLLWLGAAISVSEILTGGMLAPLGFARGLGVIIIGHLIGTVFFAGGAYVSYCRKVNAMEGVVFSLGKNGARFVALCNVVQLTGWTIIMVVQAGKTIAAVFPDIPFWTAALTLSVLQIAWALAFGSPGGKINEIAVVLLAGLCVLFFVESIGYRSDVNFISGNMTMMLGIELSIAMPVSWLPLVGDYSCKANGKISAVLMPFLGYFLGSCVMYFIGLLIVISSGNDDIFAFIASNRFRYAACGIVLLSTVTTSFVDIYSAAVSSTQWIKSRNIRIPIMVIGLFALVVSVFFPVDRFESFLENFLITISMVFVPIFVLVFLEFFMKKPDINKSVNYKNLIIVFIGIAGNWLFNKYSIFIPTLMAALLVFVAYIIKNQFEKRPYKQLSKDTTQE